MRTTIAALIALGALSSCGGGGGASSGAAPEIALTAPSTAEGGEIVPVAVTVTDDKDKGLAFQLSCNGGTLVGSLLTLPTLAAETNIECTATATDSDGQTTTVKKTIKVLPATASLTAYMDTAEAIPAGGASIVFAQNLPLEQAEYQGTLNGRAVRLFRANGNQLVYVLPFDIPAGTGELTVQVGSRIVRTAITVGAAVAVDNPREQIANFLQSARQQISASMTTPGISSQARERLQGALPQLDTALSTMASASDAEVSQLATRLAALGIIGTGIQRAQDYEPIVTGPECASNRNKFAKSLAGLVLGAILVVEGTNSAIAGALIPGAGWVSAIGSGLAIGAGVALFQKYGPQAGPSRKAFWTSCWTETTINLVPFSPGDFSSGIRVQAITLPGKQAFRPKQARSFQLQRNYAPLDSIRAQANQYLADIGKVLAAVSFLPDSVTQALSSFKVTGSEPVPAGRLSLSGITSGKVSGSATANGDVVTLKFDTSAKAEDLTNGKLPFNFTLLRSEEESVVVSAEMSLTLPEAFDAAVEATQGQPVTSSVRTTGAETLVVTEAPANGTVTLSNSGDFTYRPAGTYFGKDQFKFVARNADGESKVATVLIDVVRKFEGAWQVTVRSTTTSESRPGICPAETNQFTANVAKISDTQYSTNYAGYELVMTMSGRDDPSGPSGSKSYSEEANGEQEQGTVSISIPDSQTLRGSGSWSSSAGNGNSCTGTTSITGRR